MKLWFLPAVFLAVSAVAETNFLAGTFGYDVAFLRRHNETLVIGVGDAQVAVVPAYQGRVMTSTFGGPGGPSFGWLNYPVIEKGVVPPALRKGQLQDHIHVFGGEERFWMGPEGGQFAIFFAPGAPFEFDEWHTPAVIDTEAYDVARRDEVSVGFRKAFNLVNNSGRRLTGRIERDIRVLDPRETAEALGGRLDEGVRAVAYRTDNRLTNTGAAPWTRDTGALSIWLLGMMKPTPRTTVVIPFQPGPMTGLGPKVTDSYFGKVPPEYLVVKDDVLFFRADGQRRGKIGISPARSRGIAGSYDAGEKVLTIVRYSVPERHKGYVNSLWELQQDPFSGDAINAYNDGSPGPGLPPLGPFYELETSSPAGFLVPDETLRHVQTTVHVTGPEPALDQLARRHLGASLKEIETAFAPASGNP